MVPGTRFGSVRSEQGSKLGYADKYVREAKTTTNVLQKVTNLTVGGRGGAVAMACGAGSHWAARSRVLGSRSPVLRALHTCGGEPGEARFS